MHSHRRRITSIIGCCLAFCLTAVARAEPFDREKLPEDLKGWVDWVLHDVPDYLCPAIGGEKVCLWPGRLELVLEETGGRFVQEVFSDSSVMFELPGEAAHWPESVTVNGRPRAVIDRGGVPLLSLEPGEHQIKGSLVWTELPEGIRIPPATAMVSLTVRGETIYFPRRDDDGRLWLQGESAEEEGEKLDLSVMRRIRDAVPVIVETRIVLRASGKAREVSLGGVLIDGTVPLSVSADIPARLSPEGQLDLQVRAGTHVVTIEARTVDSPKALSRKTPAPPWPGDEIWVWQADEKLRQVTLEGAPGIDPSRTDLPDEWRKLPAYLMGPKGALTLVTSRRGEPEPPPDDLSLDRTLWMDLDGEGFTVQDALSGSLNRTWRLDLLPPGKLGHVSVDEEDQLITKGKDGSAGVELRNGALNMTAEWRLDSGTRNLAAVGWSESVQNLSAVLNLPPGWTLLTAKGVDHVSGTWWDKWNLFGFFFVLIVSIAIGKLTRVGYGAVAFVALVLSHHEEGAPLAVWVCLLVSVGLLKVLPKGKLRFATWVVWWIGVVWLAVVLVPFSVEQVRGGLFPQVREGMGSIVPVFAGEEEASPPPPASSPKRSYGVTSSGAEKREREWADYEEDGTPLQQIAGLRGKLDVSKMQVALQQDPKAVVQTGPGIPSWRWNSWRLNWTGPVSREHSLRLYLLTPKVNLALSILRVLLLLLIALRIGIEGLGTRRPEEPPSASLGNAKTAAAGAATLLFCSLLPCRAQANEPPAEPVSKVAPEPHESTPSPSILDALRNRLTEHERCRPDCVDAPVLRIEVTESHLVLETEVHAGAKAAVALPGPAKNWVPSEVLINGRPVSAVVLREDGFLHVRVEPGVHKVIARGPSPRGGALTLELSQLPKRAVADAPGWLVDGIRGDGRPESSIQLTRKVEETAGADHATFEEGAYPPWLEVTRTLDLGIPWLVHTTARRVSPLGAPVLASVPLIEGESVTESALEVENGAVVISLGRNDSEVSWSSTLKNRPQISLSPPKGVPWSEVWQVRCSPVFACEIKGLAPIQRKSDGRFSPTFRPWPGETLTLRVSRPHGVEGSSATIDSAELTVTPGTRLVSASLYLTVRTSRGGEQRIDLPKGAEVQTVTVDDAEHPFRRQGDRVTLTLRTGTQKIALTWQQEGGVTSRYQAPEVAVGGRAANVEVKIALPPDRWLIAAGGPSWGPAILFWGYLLTVLLAGFVLGRSRLSPVKSWQWMLLAFGLTQVPVPVALVIVGWFFAMAGRAAHPFKHHVLHNILQVALGVFTLAALVCLVAAVYTGLAVQPDMQVKGADSTGTMLRWYMDHTDGGLPSPWVFSVPLLVWKIIMLLWALWLAASIVRWAPWSWRAFNQEGLWRRRSKLKGRSQSGVAKPAPEASKTNGDTEPRPGS